MHYAGVFRALASLLYFLDDKRRETGAFKLNSAGNSHPKRGKISDPKTRTDGTF